MMKSIDINQIPVSLLVFAISFTMENNAQQYSSNCFSKMQSLEADYIIGGFVPGHYYDTKLKLNTEAPGFASAILYAIREINNNARILPGVILGYDIRDTCNLEYFAAQSTLDFLLDSSYFMPSLKLNPQLNTSCIERNDSYSFLVGIVGAYSSAISAVINNILNADYIPQVSYGATSAALSGDNYQSFLRTVPSDIHQAEAIVDLLVYFDWTYVSVFATDDEYGRIGLFETRKMAKKRGICLAAEKTFRRIITKQELARIVSHLESLNNKSHVVIIWGTISNAKKIMKEAQKNNINNITWIGSEAWGTHVDLKSVPLSQNIIGIQIETQKIRGFQKAISTSVSLLCENPWYRKFISKMNLVCDPRCFSEERTFPECRKHLWIANILPKKKRIGQVIASVYALAHGLHKTLNCTNVGCTQSKKIDYEDMYNNTLKSNFVIPDSDYQVLFDQTGEIYNSSYFYFIYKPLQKRKQFVEFGSWSVNGKISIDKNKIKWGPQGKPTARCSKDCKEGFYRINGSSSCCWFCTRCIGDAISRGTNSYRCAKCSQTEVANPDHTHCVKMREIRLLFFNKESIIHLSLAIFGIICTVFVICLYIKYWNSPLIKSSSREMSCLQLASILLLFAYTGLFFFDQTPNLCMILVLAFGFLHCTILSFILVKTYRLLLVFRERFTKISRFLHNKYQIAFSYMFVIVLCVAILLWFVYMPVDVEIHRNRNNLTYYTRCSASVDIIWAVVLCYILMLALAIAVMAFRARKLPANFNEAQYIGFTMLTELVVWVFVFLPLYASLSRPAIADALLYINFTSTFCILCIMYGYKVRIILFYPHLNSAEHFRNMAKGTTIMNFVKDVRRNDCSKSNIQSVIMFDSQTLSQHESLITYMPSIECNIKTNKFPKSSLLVDMDVSTSVESRDTSSYSSESETTDVANSSLVDMKKWSSTPFLNDFGSPKSVDSFQQINDEMLPRASSFNCISRLFSKSIDHSEMQALVLEDIEL